MRIDLEKALFEDVVVLTKLPADLNPFGQDVYAATQHEGCWREMPSRSTDGNGSESMGANLRLQIPDDGRYLPWSDYVALTGSQGPKEGYVMAYEYGDGMIINQRPEPEKVRFIDPQDGVWSLRKGDYVARGQVTPAGIAFRDGFVMPYETVDFTVINPTFAEGTKPGRGKVLGVAEVIKAMRAHGGYAVGSWRDCRRPVSIAGACGRYGSMIHIEA